MESNIEPIDKNKIPLTVAYESIDKINWEEELKKHKGLTLEETYNKIVTTLKYYSDLNPRYYNLAALWVIGSYINTSFNCFPYLFINAMRGSGKTRLLKLICALSNEGQVMASMTEAVLFRTKGTLAIDEFENLNSKDKNELRELLNAAYKKGIKIVRMRKKKTVDGENQVAEEFEVFRPIVMANIWGMEEVLGDRCISLQLEKSNNPIITRLVENYDEFEEIKTIKDYFAKNKCSLCSVVTKKNIYSAWNTFVYTITTLPTHTTLTTLITQTTPPEILEILTENLELFQKIYDTNIDGRNLELFFPLFLISSVISKEVLDETLDFAKKMVHDRKIDEITESKDVLVYKLISNFEVAKWVKIHEIVNQMKFILGSEGEQEWLNSKWMGRSLKRLQLVVDKRRIGDGIEVTLNIEKAKQKTEQFTKEQK